MIEFSFLSFLKLFSPSIETVEWRGTGRQGQLSFYRYKVSDLQEVKILEICPQQGVYT